MTRLSRPFQIALVAFGLLVAVWFVALRGHSSSSGGSSAAVSTSASAAAPNPASPSAANPGSPSAIYHGSAPGVEGLTRDISKAHKAVEESEAGARKLEGKPTHASGSSSAKSTPAGKHSSASRPSTAQPLTSKGASSGVGTASSASKGLAREGQVEHELKQGDVVVILFWNPKGADDVAVRDELQLLAALHRGVKANSKLPVVQRLLKASGLELDKKIAVQEASPSQVAQFGSITRTAQVAQTPTLLIVNEHGTVTTRTGLLDAFSIEQAIDEARNS
jgi:hypothetical protein